MAAINFQPQESLVVSLLHIFLRPIINLTKTVRSCNTQFPIIVGIFDGMAANCTRPTLISCSNYNYDSIDANPDVSGIGVRQANDKYTDRCSES